MAETTATVSSVPTPVSIYAQVNRLQWEDQTLSFETFLSQTVSGKWDHDPPHQREVVHNASWGSGIIESAMWFGELPALYFHPRHTSTGITYESLDGKQRASKILGFLRDEFPLKTSRAEFAHLNGKKFSEMDALNQSEIRDLRIRLRLANRTLTRVEIYELFRRLQDNKRTTTGEKLNAMPGALDELVSATIDDADELFNALIPSDKRKRRNELTCRLLKSWSFPDDDTKALTDKPTLEAWYAQASVPSDQFRFRGAVVVTLQTLLDSNLLRKQANSTVLPVFRIISKCLRADPNKLRPLCQLIANLEPQFFKQVGGDHNAMLTRYQALREVEAELS